MVIYHPSSPMLNVEGMVPPMAPLLLGKILTDQGNTVEVIDARDRKVDDSQLTDCDVLLVAGVTTPQYVGAREKLNIILENRNKGKKTPITAIGGAHVSYLGKEALLDGWDFVVRDFGEKAVGDIVRGDVNDRLIEGGTLSEEELNQQPNPDFGLIEKDLGSYRRSSKHKPTLPMMTSRGCPHDCSFCSNESWRRTVHFYSNDKVIGAAKDIKGFGVDQVVMYDDDALINRGNRVLKISRGIEKLGITWRCNTHVNTIDNPKAKEIGLLEAIKDSGCALVALGIDGVDEQTLIRYNKETTIKKCFTAIEEVKEAEMLVKIYLIYPPGGGQAYVDKMKTFINSSGPDYIGFSVLTPLPGSRDYDIMKLDKSRLSDMFYQSSPGTFGNVGLLNKGDFQAINNFEEFLGKWRIDKPEMPI